MIINNSVTSVLKLNELRFNNVSYVFKPDITENNLEIEKNIHQIDTSEYSVVLDFHLKNEQNFEISISIEGIFDIDCDNEELKNALINKNAVAILFPYIRSEVTLITSQPNIKPIVLPPININRLVQD